MFTWEQSYLRIFWKTYIQCTNIPKQQHELLLLRYFVDIIISYREYHISFQIGTFPEKLKYSVIKSIHQKDANDKLYTCSINSSSI